MNILFVLPTLKPGGAERVVSFIAQIFHNKKQTVTLLVLGYQKDKSYETGDLEIIYFNKDRLLYSIIDIYMFIKKTKPDIVFSSIGHINIFMGFLCLLFPKIRFVSRESSVFSTRSNFVGFKMWLLNKFRGFAYKNLDAIVCQSSDIKEDFIKNYNIKINRLHIIGNPITMKYSHAKKEINTELKKIKFITVGRFSEVKGHFRIIKGLSKISNYDFHYTLVGDGKLKNQIKNSIKSFNLEKQVTFIDFTSNVLEEIIKNNYFLQGSYVEGFPNAVLESCSVGVPVIAFNCPGGTKDIIVNGENGFLVNSQKEFELLLSKLNKNKINRDMIINSVKHKFDHEFIIKKYEKLFFDILNINNKCVE